MRFRTAMQKSELLHEKGNVMLAYSGGHSSSALVHLAHYFINNNVHRYKKFAAFIVCHVDESALTAEDSKDDDFIARLEMTIENNCGFEFKTIPIESTIIEQVKEAEDVVATGTGVHGLAKKWTSFAEFKGAFTRMSKTSQEDILAQLRMLALRKMAVQENCHALFLGDNSTHIAIQTISLVSKGRGFSLPIDTAKETSWFKDVIVNRPLREILTKELALFNYWEGINPVYRPSSSSFPKSSTKTSIGKLTKDFITGLLKDYPATVNTVVKTAHKIEYNGDADTQYCSFCHGPIQHNINQWRQLHTVFALNESKNNDVKNESFDMCYGCQNIDMECDR